MNIVVAALLAILTGPFGQSVTSGLGVPDLFAPHPPTPTQEDPVIKRMTPILTVESIEPSLPFWIQGLGFEKTAEVPEGEKLGFVSLEKEGIEIMLQTRSSVEADLPELAREFAKGPSVLFLEIGSLDGMEDKLLSLGGRVARPRRQTFYGADEIFFWTPGGHVVGLAVFANSGN